MKTKIAGVSPWLWAVEILVLAAVVLTLVSVTRKPENQPALRSVLTTCQFGLPKLKSGILSIKFLKQQRDRTIHELESETRAGKVVLLQRELEKVEKELADRTTEYDRDLEVLRSDISAGRAVIARTGGNRTIYNEFEAWALHCEKGIEILQQWEKDMDRSASALSFLELRASGAPGTEYIGTLVNTARADHRRLRDQVFKELFAGPAGFPPG